MNIPSSFSRCLTVWNAMPDFLQKALLINGDAGSRIPKLAEELMEVMDGHEQSLILTHIFTDMASFSWESSFFDVQAASVAHQVDTQIPILPPLLKNFAVSCAMARPGDRDLAEKFDNFLADKEMDAVKRILGAAQKKESGNLFWMRFARYLGLCMGEPDWYEAWLAPTLNVPQPVLMALKAELAFAREEWAEADSLFSLAFEQAPLTEFLVKKGECLLRRGVRDEAAKCWNDALNRRPWQVNLALRLSDIVSGRDLPKGPPPGLGKILLYSWNHGNDLARTMEALAGSNLGDAGIILLDNGSTDTTPDVARAWKERLGDKLDVITLLTNVGAPAARNWLLRLEQTNEADWVIFLDDDAIVPPGWLGHFGAAMAAYPKADIIGCRIIENAHPQIAQSIDLHFDAGAREVEKNRKNLHLAGGNVLNAAATESPDFGQFSYMRPCMSVTGCCHLLTRKSIDSVGLFDLRFSPSQFDDFERDLRAALGGFHCVYQGHLAVRHIKRSGEMAGISAWQRANIGGNLYKLWTTYTPDDVSELIEADNREIKRDLFEKLAGK